MTSSFNLCVCYDWWEEQVAFFLGLMPLITAWIYAEILDYKKLPPPAKL